MRRARAGEPRAGRGAGCPPRRDPRRGAGAARAVAVLAAIAAVAAPAHARPAPTPEQRLDAAQTCYTMLDFACARSELGEAEAGRASLTPPQQVTLDRLGAELALAESRDSDALRFLARLLEHDPRWAPPEGAWPTPWLEALERARAAAPDREPPELTVTAPLSAVAGEDLPISVSARDPSGVAGVTLFVQVPGNESSTTPTVHAIALATTDGRVWRGLIPGAHVGQDAVRLWIEASDRQGNGPARWGAPEDPKRVAVAPAPAAPVVAADPLKSQQPAASDEGPAVYETWWFWTLVGAGVAAGTGTLIYFLAESDPPRPSTGLAVSFQWPEPP